ncbi:MULTISPECIES: hypothetical protein [unclassified Roseibium]|uniref:hypothetical protein n=2 Tax=Stappiaceae TaxID=2821832 RepID=UPI00273F90B7|nr:MULTISPECIES: hypothetical protein [unclassified Roseibium]
MFDVIDKAAKYWPDLSYDPDFYAAKAYLRERLTEVLGIEIVPGEMGGADLTLIIADGQSIEVTI